MYVYVCCVVCVFCAEPNQQLNNGYVLILIYSQLTYSLANEEAIFILLLSHNYNIITCTTRNHGYMNPSLRNT